MVYQFWGLSLNFDWFVHEHYLSSTEGVIFCIIIGDVSLLIDHCLIPLDPCPTIQWEFLLYLQFHYMFYVYQYWYEITMDLLLHGSYTRLSCNHKGKLVELAKITIHPLYPHTLSPPGWTNWPISGVYVNNLNGQEFFPCHNIHVYFISIILI